MAASRRFKVKKRIPDSILEMYYAVVVHRELTIRAGQALVELRSGISQSHPSDSRPYSS